MSKINRVPFGLQDLLQSKNFGVNPSELLQEVRPSFDMLPFWLIDKLEVTSDVATASAIGPQTSIIVPLTELWLILNSGVNILNNFAAGGRVRADILVRVATAAGTFATVPLAASPPDDSAPLSAASTAVSHQVVYNSDHLWPARSGTEFTARVVDLDLNGGASMAFTHTVTYFKLQT